jgi:Tripartite tricarboxylate transporter TctB family
MTRIIGPKDFWTGIIYVSVGIAAFLIGRDYPFGSAGRMGPGYFPAVLSCLLVLLGAIAIGRSFFQPGPPIGSFPIKQIVLVIGATVLFGALINTAGLIVALLVLVLVSAAASEHFKFDWRATLGLVALVVFCSLVFVKGLGVPMPLVGTWLQPFAPSWLGG